MRAEVHKLPTKYLTNYAESFEAGIVGPYQHTCQCVIACFGNQVGEEQRLAGYHRAGGSPYVEEQSALERAYHDAHASDPKTGDFYEDGPAQAAYRVALYDCCVFELAARRTVPLTVTVASDPKVEGLLATGRRMVVR